MIVKKRSITNLRLQIFKSASPRHDHLTAVADKLNKSMGQKRCCPLAKA